MSKNTPIPVPDPGSALQWLIEHPQAAVQAVQALNLLLGLQVRLTKAGLAAFNQQQSLLISGEVIQLPLPLLWPAGVPTAVDSSSVTLPELAAVVNLILAGERSIQS